MRSQPRASQKSCFVLKLTHVWQSLEIPALPLVGTAAGPICWWFLWLLRETPRIPPALLCERLLAPEPRPTQMLFPLL